MLNVDDDCYALNTFYIWILGAISDHLYMNNFKSIDSL